MCNLLFHVAVVVRFSEKRGHIRAIGFSFQVTGDNVHSLALCDFDSDGKKEVCGGGDSPPCVSLNTFSSDNDFGVAKSVSFWWLPLALCCLNNELTGLIRVSFLFGTVNPFV